MFVASNVVYIVQYVNMNREVAVKAFKTAHDAAEWIEGLNDNFLANEAEMKMYVEPILTCEQK